jgi:putative endonuclease
MEKTYYVYLLASERNGTLYAGMTNNLARRVYEHKTEATDGFSKRYGVKRLVYVEQMNDVRVAIAREKRLKKYPRAWKVNLIEQTNPTWRDLYDEILG